MGKNRWTEQMNSVVKYTVRDGIAVITINNPPVNALGFDVRNGLMRTLDAANSDQSVQAILLRAQGRTFPAGADIKEFGKPPRKPSLPDVCNHIEASQKPVIAAIHGTTLGGGFELALASHYRIAHVDTLIGLPEIHLGLLPGAGGTQRLPRLCGALPAINVMTSGKKYSASFALKRGMIDAISKDNLLTDGLKLAITLGQRKTPITPTKDRRDGMQNPVSYQKVIRLRRSELPNDGMIAPAKIIDCVEAALLLPFESGLAFERTMFMDCMASDQSKALRHMFIAERKAAKIPEARTGNARNIEIVGVVGGGLMGAGIAVVMLSAGLTVRMVERDDSSLSQGLARIHAIIDRNLATKRITPEKHAAQLGRLHGTLDYNEFRDVDVAIEAIFEDKTAKEDVFKNLNAVLGNDAILATNTSYLDINELAEKVDHPENVIGLHFFSPAHIMKLLEVVVADKTAPDVVATGFALAKSIGKIPVRARVTDGFIGNRIFKAYRAAVEFIVEDGASPYQIDAAMREFGFKLGPFQVFDLAGLEIAWAQRKRAAQTRDPNARYVTFPDKLCENGWFGQKTAQGYYTYQDGKKQGQEDPRVLEIIENERKLKGIIPRSFTVNEIQDRCLAAMTNEGARLLEERIALRPSDIDVVMVHGYGFPRWRGGPMKYADIQGLLHVQHTLKELEKEEPLFWKPSELTNTLIKNGHGFDRLNT